MEKPPTVIEEQYYQEVYHVLEAVIIIIKFSY